MKRTTTLIAAIVASIIATPSLADQTQTPKVQTEKLDQQVTGSIDTCQPTGLFSSSCDTAGNLTGKKFPEAPALPQYGI
ncbi:MAG: hypothetical protein WA921_04000 [Ahrensia sp.]